jgi:hypothetical protein
MIRLPYVVVYKKSTKGRKHYMQVFNDIWLEDIISVNKRNPPIPHEYEIIEIGIGISFVKNYMESYNINKIEENGK